MALFLHLEAFHFLAGSIDPKLLGFNLNPRPVEISFSS